MEEGTIADLFANYMSEVGLDVESEAVVGVGHRPPDPSAPAATGLNRHSPGSASPPGLSTSAQDLGFARKRPLSQCWI